MGINEKREKLRAMGFSTVDQWTASQVGDYYGTHCLQLLKSPPAPSSPKPASKAKPASKKTSKPNRTKNQPSKKKKGVKARKRVK